MKITDGARFFEKTLKRGKRGKKGSKWVKKRKISKKNSYKLKISHKIRKNEKNIKKIFLVKMVKVKGPKMAQNGPKNGKLSKRVETISKTHIKSEKTKKVLKKYF